VEKKMNRIMLVTPKYTIYKDDVRRCVTPLGLAYLSAFLERYGYEVKIIDIANEGYFNVKEDGNFVTYGLNDERIKHEILRFRPHVVGVSCIFSTQAENAKELMKFVKGVDEGIITFTGGAHPTFAVEEMLDSQHLDYIVMGEGELPTLQLLEALNNGEDVSKIGGVAYKETGKKVINNNLQYIDNVDELPLPARHLLNMELYFKINIPHNPYCPSKRVTQILTSRGCKSRCVFCSTTHFWGNRYRGRKAQNVIAEIRELKETYNIDEIQFTDDNLTLNKRRAIEVFEGIKDLGLIWCAPNGIAVWTLDEELLVRMRESGCYQLSFAIESGNQEVLRKIVKKPIVLKKVKPLVKKAQDLGISVHAFAICGFPGEVIQEMYETYDFVEDCGFNSASFFAANPLLGSELMKICKKNGFLKGDLTCNDLLFKMGNISTPDFEAEQVQKLVQQFNRKYNASDTREKRFEAYKY
jgi:radical SAM superfamily enzyme YgiQ (UPF0313 family)